MFGFNPEHIMPLFTRKVFIHFCFCFGFALLPKAQTCSTFPIFFPDTVCLGQTVKGINLGPKNLSYEWDICAGDLFKAGSSTNIPITGFTGQPFGLKIVREGNKFHGFTISSNQNILFRLDFDTNINSVPTVVNLGNPGNSIVNGGGFEIKKVGGIYYGFTVNRIVNQLVRFTFGSGIASAPTADVVSVPTFGSPVSFSITQEDNNFFGFAVTAGGTKLNIFNFGNSLASSPILSSITIPVATYSVLISTQDCFGKYVFIGDNAGKITKVNFGSSFSNLTPAVVNFSYSPTFIGTPSAMTFAEDGGRKLIVIAGGTPGAVGLLNFGSSYQTNSPAISAIANVPVAIFGLSDVYIGPDGNSFLYYVSLATTFGRINFTSGFCPGFLANKSFDPPSVSWSVAGKYFVNYKVMGPSGLVYSGGDSVFVKNSASLNPTTPIVDFVADEQCPSKNTRFFPSVVSTGTYSSLWTFPNDFTSAQNSPSRNFLSTGVYPVSLRIRPTDGCGVVSVTKHVKIFNDPQASITSNFAPPAQVCTKDSILFLDGSSPQNLIKRWKWDFGNGQIVFTKDAKAYYPFNLGNQSIQISLKASDSSGCGTSVSKSVTIKQGADVQFSFSKTCFGDVTQFQNSTPNLGQSSFLWNFGNPSGGAGNTSTSAASQLTYTYPDSGLYRVNLKATSPNGCSSQFSQAVRIFSKPLVDFSFPNVTFPNRPVAFINKSTVALQSITGNEWNFGDPTSGINNLSTVQNPSHTFSTIGSYQVQLKAVSSQGCSSVVVKNVPIFPPCPVVSYTTQLSQVGNTQVLTINNQTTLVKETRIDFCAGDLELTPVLQSQQTGVLPINFASQVFPIKEGDQWTGFIPSPSANNSTSFFKGTFGNSLNNDISNFSPGLGNPQTKFPTPIFIRFIKEDTVWYGIASNGDSKLWRIRFGASLRNNSPIVTEIPVPVGTLVAPTSAQIVKDKDTTYLFITNNNGLSINNFIKLRFKNSIVDTPIVSVLNNPLILQNSTGFFNLSFARSCDTWYALLLAKSQLYRLNFGKSLNNIPTASSITSEVTAGLTSANAFDNLRGISLLQDLGKWYAFINTNTGSIFRLRFSNGINQSIDNVSSLGSFGIQGVVGPINFVQEGSEVFGLTINSAGTVYKFKFPNRCPADVPFALLTEPGSITANYNSSGRYRVTLTSESSFGPTTQVLVLDSLFQSSNQQSLSCKKMDLNHPDELCFNNKYKASVGQSKLTNVKWDFCTGDFKLSPATLAPPLATSAATGIQTVQSGSNYYTFLVNASGLFRLNYGESPASIPGQPIPIVFPGSGGLFDVKFFKEGNNWFALCIYTLGESIIRLNFGADITNPSPAFAIINLPGFLTRPRSIDLFEDQGNKFALIANQNGGNLVMLNFGKTYLNIPFPLSIDVPGAINLYKVSCIRDCNIWHAFVSDPSQDSLYQLTFNKGLESKPSFKRLGLLFAVGLQAVRDGNEFYLFSTKTQPNSNNLFKFSFGTSLSNIPRRDSLGNFAITTPATGLNNVHAFHIFLSSESDNIFFGSSLNNGNLYRIKFQNPCSALNPVVSGDTIVGQSYSVNNKYFISTTGFDSTGSLVSAFDSVTVKNRAEANFTIPGNRCKGEPILFQDGSIPGTFTSITNWKWSFGDTSAVVDSSSNQNPTHTFSKAGTYKVSLKVKEEGGCENELINEVQVADKPRPNFSFSTGLICTNDSVRFSDLSQGQSDPIVSRNWEIRKNNLLIFSSTKESPQFLFTETGAYQVSLKVKGQSQCDSTITKQVQVGGEGPLVSFTNTKPCLNEAVNFAAQIVGSLDSLNWFIDNGSSSITNQANFTNPFSSTNVFRVKLVTYKGGCTNSFTKLLKVNERPQFGIDYQAVANCQGLPINFTTAISSSEDVVYNWDFGDGTTDTLKNPVKAFSGFGTFNVKLKVTTDNGCDATKGLTFIAKRAPIAQFTFDKACKDEPVTFTNTSTANGVAGGITSYFWEFGDLNATTSNQKDPAPFFYNESPGRKIVRLTVRTGEECPNTFVRTFVIGSKLAANFDFQTGCLGTPFKFFDISNAGLDSISTWSWTIGGLNFNTRNPIVEFDQKGIYDVRLLVKSRSGCADEITRIKAFNVLEPAVADFTISNGTFTEGDPFRVTFTQFPRVNESYDYVWDFGDTTFSNSGNPPPQIYKREGTYVVKLKASRSGTICSTEVVKVVNVIINPIQGLRLKKLNVGKGTEKISLAVEVENQSNVAIRTFDLVARLGSLVSLTEVWTGILLPGETTTYNFKSSVLSKSSQTVQFVCVSVFLPDPGKETSPSDNSQCFSTDSLPSIVAIFPNPTSRDLMVDLNLPNTDPFEIKMINSFGQQVISFNMEDPQVGALRKTFNVSSYPNGVYYLWFRSGKRIEHRIIQIQKADY